MNENTYPPRHGSFAQYATSFLHRALRGDACAGVSPEAVRRLLIIGIHNERRQPFIWLLRCNPVQHEKARLRLVAAAGLLKRGVARLTSGE
ncbi:hypothetical protein [Collinsella tanakaei]|uniref:hypothetical protein n=1 Tax=Collinsella tanakaei TaxID=626935 RepID=UPI0025A324AF|nr:hypothetical protein [Collinsella tanakaei]MDM8299469.1 hypothetical protein [Collinsella tanakaei]